MKTLFIILLLSFNAHALQELNCIKPKVSSAVEECLTGAIAAIAHNKSEESDSPEASLAAAELFLSKYKDSVDFDIADARAITERLRKHAANTTLPKIKRSELWLFASGMHGRMADKLRANGGTEQGKLALGAIKTSLGLSPTYKKGALAYAETITAFTKRGLVARKFIEAGLGISIADEAKLCMKAMEVAGVANDPMYKVLKDF